MTLMPVSNIMAPRLELVEVRGRCGGSPSSRQARPISSVSSGSPSTLKTWPSTASPTGTVMPRPGVAHRRPAGEPVGRLQADAAHPALADLLGHLGRDGSLPVELDLHLDGRVDLGQGVGRELDVDDRAGDGDDPAVLRWRASGTSVATVVMGSAPRLLADRVRSWGMPPAERRASAAADDLHDLGGDGVLAGTVHHPRERLDQLVGIVGGRRHGPLAGSVLRSATPPAARRRSRPPRRGA